MPFDGAYPVLAPELGCLYIAGDDLSLRCGCARSLNSSYCREHHALCHIAPDQKAAAEADIAALADRFGGRSGDRLREPPKRFLIDAQRT